MRCLKLRRKHYYQACTLVGHSTVALPAAAVATAGAAAVDDGDSDMNMVIVILNARQAQVGIFKQIIKNTFSTGTGWDFQTDH